MQIETKYEDVQINGRTMRTFVATPVAGSGASIAAPDDRYPGIVFYSDIFQLTASTLRWVSRLASYGFTVAAPEIYYRIEDPGTVLEFDDDGKQQGQADVEALSAEQFDEDIAAALNWLAEHDRVDSSRLGAAGHCTGGHIGFRAAAQPQVKATALWYPTGLHNGKLGSDDDSQSLKLLDQIRGELLLIFGSRDPHTPADGRDIVQRALDSSDVSYEWLLVDGEHAFGRDIGPRWDPAIVDEAFDATVGFLRRNL